MPKHPNRFPTPLTLLMIALIIAGFGVSLTQSVVAFKVYAGVYVAFLAAWLYLINRAGS